jgi:dTDP-4-dehydrorhamnose reductase
MIGERYLITGGSGQLGSDLKMLMDGCGVHYLAPSETELDFGISESVESFFSQNRGKFSFIIHCAAFTNVDGCEAEREKAYLINAGSTETLARICNLQRIPMLYISTDFVFDGTGKIPYETFDVPAPLSVYGASKLEGEKAVRHNCPDHYIVRTSWLFGTAGNNFPRAILKKAASGDNLQVVNDQIGSPTFSRDLAEGLLAILGIEYPFSGIEFSGVKGVPAPFGTYHFSNAGAASWFDFASEILRMAGRANGIAPITSAQLGRAAARPAYSVLSHTGINSIGITARPWREALATFLSELRIQSPDLFPN